MKLCERFGGCKIGFVRLESKTSHSSPLISPNVLTRCGGYSRPGTGVALSEARGQTSDAIVERCHWAGATH